MMEDIVEAVTAKSGSSKSQTPRNGGDTPKQLKSKNFNFNRKSGEALKTGLARTMTAG